MKSTNTSAEKRFNRFFVLVLLLAALTVLLTFTTNYVARQKAAEQQLQDSTRAALPQPDAASADTLDAVRN